MVVPPRDVNLSSQLIRSEFARLMSEMNQTELPPNPEKEANARTSDLSGPEFLLAHGSTRSPRLHR